MEKKFIQDVVPPNKKRSIRNIPIPEGRSKVTSASQRKVIPEAKPEKPSADYEAERDGKIREEIKEKNIDTLNDFSGNLDEDDPLEDLFEDEKPHSKGPLKKIIWVTLIIVIILAIIGLISIFSVSEIKISPKQASATANETIIAQNIETTDGIENVLTYNVIEISEEQTIQISSTGEEEVSSKASGMITIVNNFSEKDQPLVKQTRFETEDGLIYRIEKSLVVPGKTGQTPGSIDAEVFADETGEDYNINQATFTIPGFEGQPQFDGFSAQIKTAIAGGFEGVRKVVSEEDLKSANTDLQDNIKQALSNKINEEVSDEFIIILDDSLYTFGSIKQGATSGSDVSVSVSGNLKALVFSKNDFSKYLAGETLSTFNQGDDLYINNISDIGITIDAESGSTNLDQTELKIEGRIEYVWVTDINKLKVALAGKKRKDLKSILEDFPSISKAEAIIKPFWKRKYPTNTSKIEAVIDLEQ